MMSKLRIVILVAIVIALNGTYYMWFSRSEEERKIERLNAAFKGLTGYHKTMELLRGGSVDLHFRLNDGLILARTVVREDHPTVIEDFEAGHIYLIEDGEAVKILLEDREGVSSGVERRNPLSRRETVTFKGIDSLDGVECYVFDASMMGGIETLWFGIGDGLVRQIQEPIRLGPDAGQTRTRNHVVSHINEADESWFEPAPDVSVVDEVAKADLKAADRDRFYDALSGIP